MEKFRLVPINSKILHVEFSNGIWETLLEYLAETEACHQLHLVLRHSSLGISRMVLPIRRSTAATIPTQVRHHQRELLGQARCNFAPHYVGLRIPMEE